MKVFYFCILTILLVLSPIDSALAKGGSGSRLLLGFDISSLSSKSESVVGGNTGQAESRSTFYDLTLDYMLGSNFKLGAILSSKSTSSKEGTDDSTSTTGSATGVSLGFVFDSGFHLTANYFLTASDQEYKKGSGFGADLGWKTFLSSSFYIGAKLAYRSIKYTENSTISNFTSLTSTTMLPYLSFGFGF